MNKKTIRLTESDLHRIIKESVNKVVNEGSMNNSEYQELLDAADVVCGICYYRSEKMCNKCPVRNTIDNYVNDLTA